MNKEKPLRTTLVGGEGDSPLSPQYVSRSPPPTSISNRNLKPPTLSLSPPTRTGPSSPLLFAMALEYGMNVSVRTTTRRIAIPRVSLCFRKSVIRIHPRKLMCTGTACVGGRRSDSETDSPYSCVLRVVFRRSVVEVSPHLSHEPACYVSPLAVIHQFTTA